MKSALARDLYGHAWTFGSFLRRPTAAPLDRPFVAALHDPIAGDVEVTGRIAEPDGARDAVVVLHGLGGDVTSRYAVLAAHAIVRAGLACVRLHLRGADRGGSDVYHAGLTTDLDAAIRAPELARFERLFVLGYSLGGHVALRWAADAAAAGRDAGRVHAIAAICPPIDLAAGARAIQRVDRRPYQFHVLRGLKVQYEAVARRRGELTRVAPIAIGDLRRVRTIVDWDEMVIAPRFGFVSAEDYWSKAAVAPHLGRIRVPTLLVAAAADPMIPEATVRPALAGASDAVKVVWSDRGGHVGFPDDLSLGIAPRARGLESEVVAWLVER